MIGRKILIVEDESIVRLHLQRVIEAMGHEVVGLAASAEEALACADTATPDLVLMDINLRGSRDGIETAGEIVRRHGCAVVFATAFGDDETILRTETVDPVGYLLKPFGVQAVRAAVVTALREHDRIRAAKANERSLAGIIGSLGEAVLLVDTNFRVNFANPRAQELIQPIEGKYLGRRVHEILRPASDDRSVIDDVFARAERDGVTVLLPTIGLHRRDGSEVLVDGSVEPLVDGNGGSGFVISLRDLSQRWFGGGEPAGRATGTAPRMLIYSHDTFGLGHLRRSLNLAAALVEEVPDLSILIVTGSALAHCFPLPPRVDYVKLPAVRKVGSEQYSSRSLEMPDDDVLSIRANLLLRTVRDFKPNLLLVDHSPAGMRGELRPSLAWLRDNLPGCETIIGLRDIVDDPQVVIENWREQDLYRLLEEVYDHVVVYGSRSFYDPVVEYAFPPVLAERTRFLGHVVEEIGQLPQAKTESRRIVVTAGGGDGAVDEVVGVFLEMLKRGGLGQDIETVVLPGPLAPPELMATLKTAAAQTGTVIHQLVESTSPFMAAADLVICTGGYNTTMQMLRYGKRALVIPRMMHRREQYLRAARLAQMGLIKMMLPEEIDPENLRAAISALLAEPREPLTEGRARGDIRFGGAAAMAAFCAALISPKSQVWKLSSSQRKNRMKGNSIPSWRS